MIPLFLRVGKVGRRGVITGEQLERITRITILGKRELSFLDHNNYHLLRAYVSGKVSGTLQGVLKQYGEHLNVHHTV